jgi:hypothetical protein
MRNLACLLVAAALAACSAGGGYVPRRDGDIPDFAIGDGSPGDFAGRDGGPGDFAVANDLASPTDLPAPDDFASPSDLRGPIDFRAFGDSGPSPPDLRLGGSDSGPPSPDLRFGGSDSGPLPPDLKLGGSDSGRGFDQGSSCRGSGGACGTSYDCCQGLYCQNGACTAAPSCGVIGAGCVDYTTCCESASMDCPVGRCCIEKLYQNMSGNMIRCWVDSDCCNGEICDQASGLCQ